jgi:Uma2 family endonuclease
MEATWAELVLMTVHQLLVMPEDKWRYELIEGRLVRISPTGYSHNRLSAKLFLGVAIFVPEMRQVEVCQTEGESVMLNEGDVRNGGDILPGLNIPLTSIFAA